MNQLLTQSLGHFPFLGQAGMWGWQKEEVGGQGWDRHLWDSLAPSTHPSMSTEPEGCAPSLGGSEEGLGPWGWSSWVGVGSIRGAFLILLPGDSGSGV